MDFLRKNTGVLWIIGGLLSVFLAWRMFMRGGSGISRSPTAAEIAAHGMVAPGTMIYALVPPDARTGSISPVTSIADAAANGALPGVSPWAIGAGTSAGGSTPGVTGSNLATDTNSNVPAVNLAWGWMPQSTGY